MQGESQVLFTYTHLKEAALVAMARPIARAETSPRCCGNRAISNPLAGNDKDGGLPTLVAGEGRIRDISPQKYDIVLYKTRRKTICVAPADTMTR